MKRGGYDIVQRLRAAAKHRARGGMAWADYEDAADEIERLRDRLSHYDDETIIPARPSEIAAADGAADSHRQAPQLRKVPRVATVRSPAQTIEARRVETPLAAPREARERDGEADAPRSSLSEGQKEVTG